MELNFIYAAVAALIPLLVGFVWYNPKIGFGNAWMKAADMTEEKMKSANMALIFGLSYILSLFVAVALFSLTIHQMGTWGSLMNEPGFQEMDPNADAVIYFKNYMALYGDRFRHFGHGALHGTIAGFTLALPIIGIIALFERKGFKYVAIHAGYWIVSLALMGGVICQFA